MPVPTDDVLCRFVRPRDWSWRENRPKPSAFKQANLSVWHKGRLCAKAVSLNELRIEHLAECGQAHYRSGDFVEAAAKASQLEEVEFQVHVEWRPEDCYVAVPWRQWAYAHVQVETLLGPRNFLVEFRRQLCLNAQMTVPPDRPNGIGFN